MYGKGLFLCLERLQRERLLEYVVLIRSSPWCNTQCQHYRHAVIRDMLLCKETQEDKIFPYNMNYDLGGLRFIAPALQPVFRAHYYSLRATCTAKMFSAHGPNLLGYIQALCLPEAGLFAQVTGQLLELDRVKRLPSPEKMLYLQAVRTILEHILPSVVHSYTKELIGDCQEADAAKKGRAGAKASCHRDVVDFVQFLKRVPGDAA